MLKQLQSVIGYDFRNEALLSCAMVHSSYANEHARDAAECNERLEFLGDAALELASSRYLYEQFPEEPEGSLSRRRASIVCEPSLAACARSLDLGKYLLLGKGEEKNGGRERDSLLSDAFEALIGAIFLDGGFSPAERFVRRFVMHAMTEHPVYQDAKTSLQEKAQSLGEDVEYVLLAEEGPDHNKCFTVELRLGGVPLGQGTGHNKKLAEQMAAAEALRKLEDDARLTGKEEGSCI